MAGGAVSSFADRIRIVVGNAFTFAPFASVIAQDPFQSPPPDERLVEDLVGAYSRRIDIQHRLVHEVFAEERTVRVLRMWTHYE